MNDTSGKCPAFQLKLNIEGVIQHRGLTSQEICPRSVHLSVMPYPLDGNKSSELS